MPVPGTVDVEAEAAAWVERHRAEDGVTCRGSCPAAGARATVTGAATVPMPRRVPAAATVTGEAQSPLSDSVPAWNGGRAGEQAEAGERERAGAGFGQAGRAGGLQDGAGVGRGGRVGDREGAVAEDGGGRAGEVGEREGGAARSRAPVLVRLVSRRAGR